MGSVEEVDVAIDRDGDGARDTTDRYITAPSERFSRFKLCEEPRPKKWRGLAVA